MEARMDGGGTDRDPKATTRRARRPDRSTVEVSRHGAELELVLHGRTARLVDEGGVLVAGGDTEIDDDVVFELIDSGRRWPPDPAR